MKVCVRLSQMSCQSSLRSERSQRKQSMFVWHSVPATQLLSARQRTRDFPAVVPPCSGCRDSWELTVAQACLDTRPIFAALPIPAQDATLSRRHPADRQVGWGDQARTLQHPARLCNTQGKVVQCDNMRLLHGD